MRVRFLGRPNIRRMAERFKKNQPSFRPQKNNVPAAKTPGRSLIGDRPGLNLIGSMPARRYGTRFGPLLRIAVPQNGRSLSSSPPAVGAAAGSSIPSPADAGCASSPPKVVSPRWPLRSTMFVMTISVV